MSSGSGYTGNSAPSAGVPQESIDCTRDIAIYDDMPPEIRAFLRNLPYEFSAEEVLVLLNIGYDMNWIAERIEERCRQSRRAEIESIIGNRDDE